MRRKKAILNFGSSLLYEVVVLICGFITPRLIIGHFGSEVNGLVASVAQFLSFITLLEAGVGGVVKAALYKPLAENDRTKISAVYKETGTFFRRIGLIFLPYTLIAGVALYFFGSGEFDIIYIVLLAVCMAVSTFSQYYFGITNQLLLYADQRAYVSLFSGTATVILNTVAVVMLLLAGCNSIHVIKLVTASIFILRPIIMHLYCKKHYKLDKRIETNETSLTQKWDGIGHHIATFVHTGSDVAVLTLFADYTSVSVYSVYLIVIKGVQNMMMSFSKGSQALFGNIIAKNEKEELDAHFSNFEMIINTVVCIIYSCCILLICPFIAIYTAGFSDKAAYIQPIFAVIITLAEAAYMIRLPYTVVIAAAGHYKQTKPAAFIEAGINIVLSIILVFPLGLVGVAIGTLTAMLFRTLYSVWYLKHNIVGRGYMPFAKRFIADVAIVCLTCFVSKLLIGYDCSGYGEWVITALLTMLIATAITAAISIVFFRKQTLDMLRFIFKGESKKAE